MSSAALLARESGEFRVGRSGAARLTSMNELSFARTGHASARNSPLLTWVLEVRVASHRAAGTSVISAGCLPFLCATSRDTFKRPFAFHASCGIPWHPVIEEKKQSREISVWRDNGEVVLDPNVRGSFLPRDLVARFISWTARQLSLFRDICCEERRGNRYKSFRPVDDNVISQPRLFYFYLPTNATWTLIPSGERSRFS